MYLVENRSDATVIGVDGDLDIASSGQLASMISIAEAGPQKRIIVSLEHCRFCDASGLTVLAHAQARIPRELFIVVPESARCRRIFDITGLSKTLRLVTSVERALCTA